ncbi:hypothetical protein ACH5RR_036060 [Cinchona calisaya]|uniref:F-box domain-containing protein n=1 Tax=Cinchona calisaya TaxID=153742 RepID=A0ABD2Y4I3_9GENT
MNPAEKKHVASNPKDNNNISIPEDILSLIFQQLPAKTLVRPRKVRFKALVRHDVRFAAEVRERVALIDWDCTKFWILEGFESAKWNVMDILWPEPWILDYDIRHDEYPMVHAEPIGLIETAKRFNCVSKDWCNIIEDPKFVDAYWVRSHNHNRFNLLVCRPRKVSFKDGKARRKKLIEFFLVDSTGDVGFPGEVRECFALIDHHCEKIWMLEDFVSARWNLVNILWSESSTVNYYNYLPYEYTMMDPKSCTKFTCLCHNVNEKNARMVQELSTLIDEMDGDGISPGLLDTIYPLKVERLALAATIHQLWNIRELSFLAAIVAENL